LVRRPIFFFDGTHRIRANADELDSDSNAAQAVTHFAARLNEDPRCGPSKAQFEDRALGNSLAVLMNMPWGLRSGGRKMISSVNPS